MKAADAGETAAAPAFADEVELKNGGLIRGTIVGEVVIRLDDGNKLSLSRTQIKSIRRTASP